MDHGDAGFFRRKGWHCHANDQTHQAQSAAERGPCTLAAHLMSSGW
jgi:hypothetical protein